MFVFDIKEVVHVVEDRSYRLQFKAGAPLSEIKDALFQFMAAVAQAESEMAAQRAKESEPAKEEVKPE